MRNTRWLHNQVSLEIDIVSNDADFKLLMLIMLWLLFPVRIKIYNFRN